MDYAISITVSCVCTVGSARECVYLSAACVCVCIRVCHEIIYLRSVNASRVWFKAVPFYIENNLPSSRKVKCFGVALNVNAAFLSPKSTSAFKHLLAINEVRRDCGRPVRAVRLYLNSFTIAIRAPETTGPKWNKNSSLICMQCGSEEAETEAKGSNHHISVKSR